ncbi:MAG: response regulator [Acidobacteriota bacterium]
MKLRVLLADDDADLRFLTACTLEDEGWEVTGVPNGREAIERLRQGAFDLVILDAQMPVMDGFEAYELIRQDALFSAIPIMFLTAQSTLAQLAELGAGLAGHIKKPYDVDTLARQIEALLQKARPGPDSPG